MTETMGVLLLVAASLSCTEDSPCPAGQQFDKGYCTKLVLPADGAAAEATTGPDTGAAAPDAAAPADSDLDSPREASATTANFGSACNSQTDCNGAVSYCALQPGVPVGYCTAPGCDTTPQICPVGWTCFNVGVFKPGEPYICLRPST
jgi:hypothetical protein